MDHIILPELASPFPSAISPYAEIVRRDTVEWVERRGLIATVAMGRRVRAANFGGLAARIHPDAPLEILRVVSAWYAWMFFEDDQCDETELGNHPEQLAVLNARYLEILQGANPTEQDRTLVHALHDLRTRLERLAPGVWLHQFIRRVSQYFDATVWEATNRQAKITPELVTYIRMRPLTAGLGIDTEFVQIAEGMQLPQEILQHSVVSALTLASNNAVCWANDIMSLEKEVKRGDVHNLVLVLQHADNLPLQEAVNRAAAMYHREVDAFVDLESRLPSLGPAADTGLARYVSVLRTRMRGSLDWGRDSGRYRPQ